MVVARRRTRLTELARELSDIEVLAADLTKPSGRRSVEARLTDADRPIDLLVNNAGFGTSGRFATLDAGRLADEIRVNVLALTLLSRGAVDGMVARQRGWILNVASVAGFQPWPDMAVYAATKAYVISLSESLHEDLRGSGVRVTALCPGLTRTEFMDATGSELKQERLPSGVWMTADEVAATGLSDMARGRAVSIPGAHYKAFVATSSVIPRSLMRRAAGTVASWRSPGATTPSS